MTYGAVNLTCNLIRHMKSTHCFQDVRHLNEKEKELILSVQVENQNHTVAIMKECYIDDQGQKEKRQLLTQRTYQMEQSVLHF